MVFFARDPEKSMPCAPKLIRVLCRLLFFVPVLLLLPLAASVPIDPLDYSIIRQFVGNLTKNGAIYNPGSSTNPCEWFNYACDNNGKITKISLDGYNFSTTIPPVVTQLTELQEFKMSHCEMLGTIPPEIFRPNLLRFDVRSNYLTGTIPLQVMNSLNLTHFHVGSNSLSGVIPDTMATLKFIVALSLNMNRFQCPFPVNLYQAMRIRPAVQTCMLSMNPFDITHDGTICNNTMYVMEPRTVCRLFPILASEDLRDRKPDFQFETTTTKFEAHGPLVRMQPKQPDGSVSPSVYATVRVPSVVLTPLFPSYSEEWKIRKFDNFTEISPGSYQLLLAIDSVYASGISLLLNTSQINTSKVSLSVTLHNLTAKELLPMRVVIPLMLHSHLPTAAQSGPNGNLSCSSIFANVGGESICSTGRDRVGFSLQSMNRLQFTWFHEGPQIAFAGQGNLSYIYQNGTAVEPKDYNLNAYITGDRHWQQAVTVGFSVIPTEYQGIDLIAEMARDFEVSGDLTWSGISWTLSYPTPPLASASETSNALGAIAIAPFVLIAGSLAVFLVLRRKRAVLDTGNAGAASAIQLDEIKDSGLDESLMIASEDIHLMQQLGTGSIGTVHLATYKGEFVAVKQLRKSSANDNSLLREAALMASIRQTKNVVKLLGVSENADRSYSLVMEFCPRGSLSSYLKRHMAVSEYDEFKLLFSIAEGMVALSSSNLVHCDLAARNILLDERMFAKVSDFSYSHQPTDARALAGQNVANSIGPIKWQAPEVLNHDFADKEDSEEEDHFVLAASSDVWSYGCTAIEIFTHAEPYHGYKGSLLQLANEVRRGNLNPLKYIESSPPKSRPRVPEWIVPLLRSCFQPKPADRPTFREIRYQLTKINRKFFNEYENEVDAAESLLTYQQTQIGAQPAAPASSRWMLTAPSDEGRNGNNKTKSTENKEIQVEDFNSGKVDLSQVQTLGLLGEGSFGSVFLGISQGTYVAIKVLAISANTADLQREAAVMASIQQQHRNIVQLYGLLSDPSQNKLSIVMEFVPRGSLDSFIKAAPPAQKTEGLYFRWAVGIARGMKTLAASGIVHRDLATRNVLLDSTLEAKISDFGLSRVVLDASQESSTRSDVGPVRWFAPECFELRYSEKSDVWAFGCTLIEILTGNVPFHGMSILEAVTAVRDKRRSPLEFLLDQSSQITIPTWLCDTMKLCFEYEPKDRATFAELVAHLEERGRLIAEVAVLEEEIQKRRLRRAGSLRLDDGAILKNVK